MENKDTAAAIIRELATIQHFEINGVPVIIMPVGTSIKTLPELMSAPARIETAVVAHDVTGFVDYVNKFKLATTALFASMAPSLSLKGMLDYHGVGAPSHCGHMVTCGMSHSEEWLRWKSSDRKAMTQKAFGEFLEENLKDVTEPGGAELLNMALSFSSSKKVEFKSAQRLQDGQTQFNYVEGDGDGAGQTKLPERISLGLPVFRGDTHGYPIKARLKYSLKEGLLTLWYELERPDLVVDQAYADVLVRLEKDTGIKPYRGMA